MKRSTIVLIVLGTSAVVFSLYLWFTRPIDISSLDGKLIQYSDLPLAVADIFRNTEKYGKAVANRSLISTDSTRRYSYEVVTNGPFIAYLLIIRDDGVKFKVPSEKAAPFVIHQGQLFIPTVYNVRNSEKATRVPYERYTLPD